MKPKIITGEEVVGYVCCDNELCSVKFSELNSLEQFDYEQLDEYRKFIYIEYGTFEEELPMFYCKKDLLEHVIAITDEKILRNNKQIQNLHKEIREMSSLNSGYYEQLEGEQ